MNGYTKTERQRRQIEREHFMLYHFLYFPECRDWTVDGMMLRLKAEGLIAPSTSVRDCTTARRFWRELISCKLP